MSNHISAKKEDISSIVLMPGDINRCDFIAKNYLTDIKIVNTIRANIAYTGYYKDKKITIFPSGMGIGSMGIYSYELYNDYDVSTIIRIGTCGSYYDNIKIGNVFIADKSYSKSSYYEELFDKKCDTLYGNKDIATAVKEVAFNNSIKIRNAGVYTVEAFYAKKELQIKNAKERSLLICDMETYGLYANAEILNKKALSLLTVSDIVVNSKQKPMTAKDREEKIDKMVFLALETAYMLQKEK